MNNKTLSSILDNLNAIQNNLFDESNIKEILIDIRDSGFVEKNSLLKEICHFIAHPYRNQGLFVNEMKIRYFQLKYAPMSSKEQDECKFNIHKLSIDDFKTLIVLIGRFPFHTVNKKDFFENPSFKYSSKKFNKKNFINVVRSMYTKGEKHYILNDEQYNDDKWEELCLIINFILKLITVDNDGKYGIFKSKLLIKELNKTLNSILSNNNAKIGSIKNYKDCVITNQEEVILCIISLLQDSKFSLNKDVNINSYMTYISNKLEYRYLIEKIPGYLRGFSIPLFSIKDIENSLNFKSLEKEGNSIPLFKIVRENKILIAVKCDSFKE